MRYDRYQWISRTARMMDEHCVLPWSAEYQAGNWSEDVTGDWGTNSPENHEFAGLVGLGHGYRGIAWYMFHDREHWGFAPVSDLGHRRYTHQAIKKVVTLANGIQDLAGLEAVREVALMFYRPFAWLSHIIDPGPCNEDGLIVTGEPLVDGIQSGKVYKELEGLVSLLSQAGFNPGIIDPWWKPEGLGRFRALFVPSHSFMDEKTQGLLVSYVKGGGILLVGPWVPEKNLQGKPTRILSEVIGSTKMSFMAAEFLAKMKDLSFRGYEVACKCQGEALATVGRTPVVTTKKMGKGKVVFLGTLIGQAYPEKEPAENVEFLRRLLGSLGILPVVETGERFVEGVVRKSSKECLLYLYNLGIRAKRVRVKFPRLRVKKLVDFWTKKAYPVRGGEVELPLDVKSASVFRVE